MQAVGADDNVESTSRRVPEDDIDPFGVLGEARDGVTEEVFDLVVELAVKQIHEVAAEDFDLGDESLPVEIVGPDGRAGAASLVDPRDPGLVESDSASLAEQAHSFDHRSPGSSQIHSLSSTP